jgi:hypothetical protein
MVPQLLEGRDGTGGVRHEHRAGLRVGDETVWPQPGLAQLCIGEQTRDEDVAFPRQVGHRSSQRRAFHFQSATSVLAPGIDQYVVAVAEQPIDHRFTESSHAEESDDAGHVRLLSF